MATFFDTRGLGTVASVIRDNIASSSLDHAQIPSMKAGDKYANIVYDSIDAIGFYEEYTQVTNSAGVTENSLLTSEVFNPFRSSYYYTYRFAIGDYKFSNMGTVKWGSEVNSFAISQNVGHFLLNSRLELRVGETSTTAADIKFRYVDDLAIHILKNVVLKQSGLELEIETSFGGIINKVFKLDPDKIDVYNVLIGQQIKEEFRIASIDEKEFIPLSQIINVLPVVDTLGNTVGTSEATPSFNLLGMVVEAGVNNLAAQITGPTYESTDVGDGDVVTLDREGAVVEGYNGLQTYKVTHEAFAITHFFAFWYTKDYEQAIPICLFSENISPKIFYEIRSFAKCIKVRNGTSANVSVPTISAQPFGLIVYTPSNVANAYTKSNFLQLTTIDKYKQSSLSGFKSTITDITIQYLVKEYFFAIQDTNHETYNNYSSFHQFGSIEPTLADKKLKTYNYMKFLNGTEIRESGDPGYYELVVPFLRQDRLNKLDSCIGCVTNALIPDTNQPTSYANYSGGLEFRAEYEIKNYSSTNSYMFKCLFKILQPVAYSTFQIQMGYLF